MGWDRVNWNDSGSMANSEKSLMSLFDNLFNSSDKPGPRPESEMPKMIWFYTEGTPFGKGVPMPLIIRVDIPSNPFITVTYRLTAYQHLYKRCTASNWSE